MKFAVLVFLISLQDDTIPEVKVTDQWVASAINAFIDSTKAWNSGSDLDFQVMGRIVEDGESRVIYLEPVISLGDFMLGGGTPDAFSNFSDKIIFWYDRRVEEESLTKLLTFYNQFESRLINDLDEDGKVKASFDVVPWEYYSFVSTPLRFEVNRDRVNVRYVCAFPTPRLFSDGYMLDENGDLMFSDGYYDRCSLDSPFSMGDFRIDELVARKGLSIEPKLYITLSIDKDGNVVKVDIEDRDGSQSRASIEKYKEVIKTMRNQPQATVNGKRVKYRVSLYL